MKTIWILLLLSSTALAQNPRRGAKANGMQGQNMRELRDTLRFIRLAETKKNLNLSDAKLLIVNQIIDEMDEERFNLKREERQLKQRLKRTMREESGDGVAIIDEMMKVRQRNTKIEVDMWAKIKKALTAREAVDFVVFFEGFQRDVQRRIRMLQNQRGGGMNKKNRRQ